MGTAKYQSFKYGEVSPSLRHIASIVPYQEGLSTLKNGIVRRTSGVSNRPGFRFLGKHPLQDNIPDEGERSQLTLHGVQDIRGEDFIVTTFPANLVIPETIANLNTHTIAIHFFNREGISLIRNVEGYRLYAGQSTRF